MVGELRCFLGHSVYKVRMELPGGQFACPACGDPDKIFNASLICFEETLKHRTDQDRAALMRF